MKFTVLQENLSKGLGIINKAVSQKASLPILSNVLISTDNGRLCLAATDLEKSFTYWIGAKIDTEGSITVPAKFLIDFVNNLSPSQIEGHVENNILYLSSDKAAGQFNGIDAKEFPLNADYAKKGDFSVSLPQESFSKALDEVAFASATDESRPMLTGVYINIAGKELTMAAVDGFRLSERKLALDTKVKEPVSFVVPSRTLHDIARISNNSKTPLNLSVSFENNMALFECDDFLATTRLLEGTFPDYKRIIPQSSNIQMKVNSQDFLRAVKTANIFAKDSSNVVKVSLSPEEGMYVSGEAQEIGNNRTLVDAEITGDSMEALFDGRFLNEFLSNVKSEQLSFETEGGLSPAVFKPHDRDDYIHIVMPRRP